MESIHDLTRRAYTGDAEARKVPVEQKTKRMSLLEQATLGYAKSAREAELKRSPSRPALGNVLGLINRGALPEALRPLAQHPPSREEAAYLSPDVQRLADDMLVLDKAIEAIPKLESQLEGLQRQKDDWTREAIRLDITDKSKRAGDIEYPMHMDSAQRALTNLVSERDNILRGAKSFAEHGQDTLQIGLDRLGTLRIELEAPMPYQEARSGLSALKKPVLEWLKDLKVKGSFEERQQAKAVLDAGGIDAQGILTEVERQGMNPVDRAVAEAKDRESGKATTPKQALPESPKQTPEADRVWRESLESLKPE